MTTGSDERSALLARHIRNEIDRIELQRRRNKRQAFGLRIFLVTTSATTTILLGFKVGSSLGQAFTNAALLLSAVATVTVAVDTFYDPRRLWILEVTHLARLQAMERKLADKSVRSVEGLTDEDIDGLRNEFETFMDTHLEAWKSLREQQSPPRVNQASRPEQSSRTFD